MSGGVAASGTGEAREAQLARAYDEVEAAFERVDLAEEPALAEATIDALAAIDRARAIAEGD